MEVSKTRVWPASTMTARTPMDPPYWGVRAPCVPEIRRANVSWRDQVNIVERRVRNRVTR